MYTGVFAASGLNVVNMQRSGNSSWCRLAMLKSSHSDLGVLLSVCIVHFQTNVTDTTRHMIMQTLNDRMPKNTFLAALSRACRIARRRFELQTANNSHAHFVLLLLIFQQCVNIFAWKLYAAVRQSSIHFLWLYHQVWLKYIGQWHNYAASTTTTPYFSALQALSSPVACWWLWKEPVCWCRDESADLDTDRVTADAWSNHYWQPQPCRQSGTCWSSPPPCSRVLVAALPRWSAKRLSTHRAPS